VQIVVVKTLLMSKSFLNMQKLFGFVVFNCRTQVSEGAKGDSVYVGFLRFFGHSFSEVSERP
jgi:hypothetical protein